MRPAQAELGELLVVAEGWSTPAARERLVDCLVDFVSAVFAGLRMPQGRAIARRYASENVRSRAFALSYLAELSEFSHGHNNGAGHVGSTTLPVALVLAAEPAYQESDVTAAVLMGYEAFSRVGASMMPVLERWGSVQTGLIGSLGAAATAAGIAAVDSDGMCSTLGVAAYLTPLSPREGYASKANSSEAAAATLIGILAAELAAAGFDGSPRLVDDLYRRILGDSPRPAFGGPWPDGDLGIDHLYFKPYPCCRFTHGAIQATLEAIRDGVQAEAVEDVEVQVPPRAFRACGSTPGRLPTTYLERQFSIAYLVALAFRVGRVTPSEVLTPAFELDAAALEFAGRVRVVSQNNLSSYGNICPSRVIARLRSGETVERSVLQPWGCPTAPMTRSDIACKFERTAGVLLDPVDLNHWKELISGLAWRELSRRMHHVLRRDH